MRTRSSGSRIRLAGCAFVLSAGWLACLALATLFAAGSRAQMVSQGPQTPQQLIADMVAHEDDNQAHRDRYEFLSQERSDRTGGHMWTERVVETNQGRVRMLLAEDGVPLSADRAKQERARLDAIAADPAAFIKREAGQSSDEQHARQMLDLLPKAFVFDNVRLENGVWRLDFHPNPDYAPNGLEERVLHGMSGSVVVDDRQRRMMHIEGKLPADVSIGFGFLATVRAGSRFASDRADLDGHWRTLHVVTDIRGKAVLFKTVSKNSEVSRSEFHYLDPGITVAQAVALLEKP